MGQVPLSVAEDSAAAPLVGVRAALVEVVSTAVVAASTAVAAVADSMVVAVAADSMAAEVVAAMVVVVLIRESFRIESTGERIAGFFMLTAVGVQAPIDQRHRLE